MTRANASEEPPHDDRHSYNTIFETLVNASQRDAGFIEGLVAYGLYKIAKREWVIDVRDRLGRSPNDQETKEYVYSWTPSRLDGLTREAREALADYAESAILSATPDIREDALRGSILRTIGLGIAANFLFTLILIGIAAIVYFANPDILGIIERWRGVGT